jgi:UDP-4-amino-4,6-dideoxy-N-acetyl-beta-L-altrosamine N-acetyltransferase
MDIERYGIKLARLRQEHLEMVRGWRNQPEIVANMEYKEEITAEMQREWFKTIDNAHHHYFVVSKEGRAGGLIHIGHIDWNTRKGDTGLFIAEADFLNTPIPVLASLAMLDVFFLGLGLQQLTAKVLATNLRAVQYNAALGFRPIGPAANPLFERFFLTPEHYMLAAEPLRRAAIRLAGNRTQIKLSDSPIDTRHFTNSAELPLDGFTLE